MAVGWPVAIVRFRNQLGVPDARNETCTAGTLGIVYGVASAVLLYVVGVVFFNERLSRSELAGIAAGAVAIVLLGRAPD